MHKKYKRILSTSIGKYEKTCTNYNLRIQPLRNIKTLCDFAPKNTEAKDSDLFVFVDGVRPNIQGEQEKIKSVREYVKTITGFRSLHYDFAKENQGLGNSIIHGVSTVINQYGTAIIIEDDLVLAPNFLAFMNEGLQRYKDEQKIFSICGYSNKVKVPKGYAYDTYFVLAVVRGAGLHGQTVGTALIGI